MVIKKFLGKTEEEAVEAAKKELGNSVVIMNVKQVKRKGLFAAFRSKIIEVTVALEEEPEIHQASSVSRAVKKVEQVINNSNNSNEKKENQNKAETNGNSAEDIAKRLDSLQALLESQMKANDDSVKEEEKKDNKENKEGDEQEAEAHKEEQSSEQDKFLKLLYNTMIDNEIDEKYANQLIEDLDKSMKPNVPLDYLLANIYQKMILKFGETEGICDAENGTKVVIFIGPTGVGKTTTIAKLASKYAVDEKKKVALLTADTYRIAAAEQLRTYANILEVPFRVVYTEEELKNAVNDFKDYDYIFVDTAGHSHQNEQQLGDMKVLLDSLDDVEKQCFLVLSATTKYKDLLKISETYSQIVKYQLIFTKLDETATVGNLLNVRLAADSKISYVTCGQNVPDDIEKFDAQSCVKRLLGGKR